MAKAMKVFVALLSLLATACTTGNQPPRMVGQSESDRIELTAEFMEPVADRLVIEGQMVKQGELVLRQDATRIQARIAGAEAEVAFQKARLDELVRGPRTEQIEAAKAELEGARKDWEFRKTELLRQEQLLNQKLTSPDQVDRARTARDTSRSSLSALEARLEELLTGTTVEELRQAEAQVRVAEANLKSLMVDLDRHSFVAPVDAIVDSLILEPGERPQTGQPVAILLAGSQAYARIYVPEMLRADIGPGVEASVYVDGVDTPLNGRVRWVSSEATFTPYFALTQHDRGRLSYVAKVDILNHAVRIPDGVPLEVVLTGAAR